LVLLARARACARGLVAREHLAQRRDDFLGSLRAGVRLRERAPWIAAVGVQRAQLPEQGVDDVRGELASGLAAQLLARRLVVAPAAVHAVGGHRLVRVAGGDDARAQRNLVSGEAIRVALSVPALVARP